VLKITDEDKARNKMYLEQRKRTELKTQVGNLEDFLKQLSISVNIKNADDFTIPRISQLTLKTNQFNLTTRRYQEEDIRKFSQDSGKIVKCAQIEDKFGDNGITGYIIAVPLKNATCHIASLAVKPECRRKKVASSLLSSIIEVCSSEGYKNFILEVSTANKPAIRLYLKHGFRVIGILPNCYSKSRHAYLMLYIDDSLWFRV
jgi:FkbH-like protein